MATTRRTARGPAKVPAKKAAKTSARKSATADAKPRAPTGETSTPTADDVAAQLQRTHAQVVAAIVAGQGQVEEAMKLAEAAVAQAVRGAGEALRLAQKATK